MTYLTADRDALAGDLFRAAIDAATKDWAGHLPNCGYTDDDPTCGCAQWGARLHAAINDMLAGAVVDAATLADDEAREKAAAARALREAADDPTLRLSGHSGISIKRLRDLADRMEGSQ